MPRDEELRALAKQYELDDLLTDEILAEAQAYAAGAEVDREELQDALLQELTRSKLRANAFKILAERGKGPNEVNVNAMMMIADALADMGADWMKKLVRLGEELQETKRECARQQLASAVTRVRDEQPGISRRAVARMLLREHGRRFDRNDAADQERAVRALAERIARMERGS